MPQIKSCPEAILSVIPWYPGGLTSEERGVVEAHAADCQACRAELSFLLGDEEPVVLELPDADQIYARVLERIQAHDDRSELQRPAAPRRGLATRMFATARRVRQRIVQPVGIAAGLLVAVASGMLTVGVIWVARDDMPRYETALAAPQSLQPSGVEIEIVFQPDAAAQQIATDLRAAGANLTSGPDALKVYRARLAPDADVDAALNLLRGAGHGVATFAERSIR